MTYAARPTPVPAGAAPLAPRQDGGRCRHHWLIEASDARQGTETVDAVCDLCNATRTYPKFWESEFEKDCARVRARRKGCTD